MSKFENVTVVKAANVYFDGQVTSRSVEFADGTTKTLGIMLPGDYEFGTSQKEIMEILSGDLEVLLPNASINLMIDSDTRCIFSVIFSTSLRFASKASGVMIPEGCSDMFFVLV